MRALALVLLIWPVALPAADRSETLAELRQGLEGLLADIQDLRSHLAPAGSAAPGGFAGSPLLRLAAIERELQRLTAKTEELEYRIDRIVRDGETRLSALDLRLCTLEPGCSPLSLAPQPPLGGAEAAPAGPAAVAPQVAAGQAERDLFEAARAALGAGDFAGADGGFGVFLERFPDGPLSVEAHLLQGQARVGLHDHAGAGRAFLTAFSADRSGPLAAEALTRLGRVLGEMGQVNEACVTLGEVATRFPSSPQLRTVTAARAQLGCP